jgi:NADH:ubiquinone oxidoreductase subunit H
MLMVFLLAEYLHLVISSVHFVLFFIGGWVALKIFCFLPPLFLNPHDSGYWSELFNNFIRM